MVKKISIFLTFCFVLLSACSPKSAPPVATENPLESPEAYLGRELEIPVEEVTLMDTEQVEWTDACLEAGGPGESCALEITPGYRLTLNTSQGIYQIHTDQSGEMVRIVPPGGTPVSDGTAIVWERSGGIAGICQQLSINFDGSYRLMDCINDHVLSEGNLTENQFNELSTALEMFGSHTWELTPPEGSADMFLDNYVFNGKSSKQPTAEEQEQLNQWLAGLATELLSNPSELPTSRSGVQGQSVIGPACPVQQENDAAAACPDKQPYQSIITVFDAQNVQVTSFQTDAEGHFKIALQPGEYTLLPETPLNSPYPRAEKVRVTVDEGEFVQVEVVFDSGIR